VSVVPAGTTMEVPVRQAGKAAGKPQASATLANGLVNGRGPLQPAPTPFTPLACSARQTDEFGRFTESAASTDAGARNWPFAVSVPSLRLTPTSPAATLLPSAPTRRSASSA